MGIEFRHVVKRFENGTEALSDVSIAIPTGSMTFLTGHSGAGKTTFLNLLLRLDSPTRGSVLVNDVDIAGIKRRHLPVYRRHLGVVFQDGQLLDGRSIFDNVALPLHVAGTRARDMARRVRAALGSVDLLAKARLLPAQLSAGERQRVVIARAVVNRPKILLADEPTGNLDPTLSRTIIRLFRRFHDVGVTVVVASHDTELVGTMGSRVVELDHGRIVGQGGTSADG
ncbi:MAG: cell division ATP-binding protein FtsE [Gammaproteobacteria bacterium]|nr:cell division ATP-binding protein FtsE [Gammaproteobacteria bacterium]MYF27493.1 cell division ATP-binding protein FtsE [Gammaproteobacteria bacterium]MYK46448.1 cell division ATP-binding protein FtsE [Gammaproteobacteria bacterium]